MSWLFILSGPFNLFFTKVNEHVPLRWWIPLSLCRKEGYKGHVLVCGGCHNKLPQIGWLKKQKCIVSEFCRLEFQDQSASSVGFLWGLWRESIPWLSPSYCWYAGHLWHSYVYHPNLCLHVHVPFSMDGWSACPTPVWPHLNLISNICNEPTSK